MQHILLCPRKIKWIMLHFVINYFAKNWLFSVENLYLPLSQVNIGSSDPRLSNQPFTLDCMLLCSVS